MKYIFIFMDNSCTFPKKHNHKNKDEKDYKDKYNYQTKCKSMAAYKALYTGPDFEAHYSYAEALISVYTAFFFGIQMPILFPIAAFALFNTYVTDRILVAYYYSIPPSMNGILND